MASLKKISYVLVAFALVLLFNAEHTTRFIDSAYHWMWSSFHYGYEGIDSADYVKTLSYSEKIVCHKDYYDQAMREFLGGNGGGEKTLLNLRSSRRTESVWIGEKRYVIKTGTKKGFFANLLTMGLGVEIWNNAYRARELGIPTLKPIAFCEKRTPVYSESVILYLWEGVCGNKAIKERSDFLPFVDTLLDILQKTSVLQVDFRLKNIVVLSDNTLQLIDIDAMHQYPKYSFIFHKRLTHEIKSYHKSRNRLCPCNCSLQRV